MNEQSFNPVIPDVKAIYARLAATLGNVCVCTVCKRRQTVDGAVCLRHGWPMCCGRTMHLESGARGATRPTK